MLFNSYAFIFVFLPIALLGFFVLGRLSNQLAAFWLMAASLIFYGDPISVYVLLLVGSVAFNFACGTYLARENGRHRRALFWAAIAANLTLLAYFKYTNFFVAELSRVTGIDIGIGRIILPTGISFFTFTQIAFLVDTYRGKVQEFNLIHYALFVSYFPHLIAGPVLHHGEMMPQFRKPQTYRFDFENIAVGLTIFLIGLFKKVILADNVATYVSPVFDVSAGAASSGMAGAWMAALAFGLQLYFDFSGYSDMAIGLSRMFGVILPLNFASPYKAVNIIEFWRRWHMTLSRFLRDYLYIALGGNRHGPARRHLNLLITMLLGGLWHGAGWTFLAWGGLHGLMLVGNHAWQGLRRRMGQDPGEPLPLPLHGASVVFTFLAVTIAWVFFRAPDFETAVGIVGAMVGVQGSGTGEAVSSSAMAWIGSLMLIAWFAPNTSEIMRDYRPALDLPRLPVSRLTWRPTGALACVMAVVGLIALINLRRQSVFLYFRF
jgi:alginate O-acetyltransferase complex protein AlgI